MLSADLTAEIASDEVLEQAYLWLCDRRKDYSPDNDVWTLRWRWREVKPRLQEELLSGSYRFTAVERVFTGEDTLDILVVKGCPGTESRHHRIDPTPRSAPAQDLLPPGRQRRGEGGGTAGEPGDRRQRLRLPLGREEVLRQHGSRYPPRPVRGGTSPTHACSTCFGNTCGDLPGVMARSKRCSPEFLTKIIVSTTMKMCTRRAFHRRLRCVAVGRLLEKFGT